MDNAGLVTVVIPSLNPDEKLKKVIEGLREIGMTDIIVVNDGSDEAHLPYFPAPGEFEGCTVLTHPQNQGKGAAIKTAMRYFLDNRKNAPGLVTADGDGQHTAQDIRAVAQAMTERGGAVLGVRDFSLPQVPRRSRMGNKITRFVFHTFCGVKTTDTQTGLRAFETRYLPQLLEVKGTRYEYETNVLLQMQSTGVPCSEVPIQTVYIEENQTSHFRTVRDAVRIYGLIIKFLSSSIASSVIDLAAFYLLSLALSAVTGEWKIFACTAAARVISSFCNFLINKNVVFGNGEHSAKTVLRYYALAVPVMAISASAVWLISKAVGDGAHIVTLFKLVVDVLLFIVSFRIQRQWVFSNRNGKETQKHE